MSEPKPQFPGTAIRVGSLDLVVPPLSLGQQRRFDADIQQLTALADAPTIAPGILERWAEAIASALSDRAVPRVTKVGDEVQVVISAGEIEALCPATPAPSESQAMEKWVEIIHAAVSRNHPDLSIESLWENLDLCNFPEVVRIVMGRSGYQAAGESPVPPSPGGTSTPK